MADSTITVKVVPEIDEEALRDAIVKVIAGHAVVRPGETLVIRCGDWNADQAEQYQDYLDHSGLPFRALVVVGDELAVARPEPVTVVGGTVMGDADIERLTQTISRNLRRRRGPGGGPSAPVPA
jgi:hypothetical protein